MQVNIIDGKKRKLNSIGFRKDVKLPLTYILREADPVLNIDQGSNKITGQLINREYYKAISGFILIDTEKFDLIIDEETGSIEVDIPSNSFQSQVLSQFSLTLSALYLDNSSYIYTNTHTYYKDEGLNIISCDGATNTIAYNSESGYSELGVYLENAYMDSILLEGFGEGGWLDIGYTTNNKIVSDFDNNWFINLDNVDHRLEFVFVGESPITSDYLFPNNNNPTLSVESIEGTYNGNTQQGYITTVKFCLSGQTNFISCSNASTDIYFESLSQGWITEVNGIVYEGDDPISVLENNFSSTLGIANDNSAYIYNTSSQPIRIRLTPISNYEYTPFYSINNENNNSSFMELENGSLVFCLAANIAT